MKKIRYLSLIELTAFYDALGVELKRNRGERVRGRGTVLWHHHSGHLGAAQHS